MRRIDDDRGLDFSSFPRFPDDVFDLPGGAAGHANEDDDDGNDVADFVE